jgi:hypothetical protein
MIRNAPTQSGILTALILSACFAGCRKEGADDPSSRAKQESSRSAEAGEANPKKAALESIQLQEKDFRSRLEQAKAGVAKLGNKTRKKLKPDLASLDSANAELAHVRKFLR